MTDDHGRQHELFNPPSKSSRKREMAALRDLGRSLLGLNARQLAALDLPAELLTALREYQRLPNSHEAKRRQLQYIGKLMRHVDHQSIAIALEKLHRPDPAETRRGRCIEQWAACLLADEDRVSDFLASCPAAERQVLRQLVRNSRNDEGRSRRRLIDYLNTHISADSPGPPGADYGRNTASRNDQRSV